MGALPFLACPKLLIDIIGHPYSIVIHTEEVEGKEMIVVRDADVTRLFAREVDDFVSPAAGNSARIQQFPILREQRGEKTVEL